MKFETFHSIREFAAKSNLRHIGLAHVLAVLHNTYSLIEALEEFTGTFEDFLLSLVAWDEGTYNYWESLYMFRGEISWRCTIWNMHLEDAIDDVIKEYDI